MARSISEDLRRRVCRAIEGGMSCRQAATRFSVSPSSAIRWWAQMRGTGSIKPCAQGGDRRSCRIEAHADFLIGEVGARPDITLAELQGKLAERGIAVGIGTLWRFFDRRRITLKKRRRMPPSSSARTSLRPARPGSTGKPISIPPG